MAKSATATNHGSKLSTSSSTKKGLAAIGKKLLNKATKPAPKKTLKPIAKKPAKAPVQKKTKKSASPKKTVAAPAKAQPSHIWDFFELDAKYKKLGFATRAIHCGNEPDSKFGGVSPAIDLSTTFAQPYPGQPVCFDYARCGNPTRLALERNLASLENAKYAFALNSGCSSLLSIMNLLSSGDHVLCIDDVYGGTQRYMRKILSERQGIQIEFADFSDLNNVKKAMKPNTKIVWAETPTNPTLKICDIAGVAKICKEKKALLVVDNTFFTPYLQNPLDLGADMVVHSITKYIGGHSDVVMGAIMLNDKALYDKLFFTIKSIGSGASPFDCYLALRGSKTLAVRVERAMQNAQLIANLLEKHPKVDRVIYPGLKSHPQYELCKKQSKGPGAMISFYIKGDIKTAENFLRSVKLFTLAESLGGVESLIENPALMTHFSVPPEQRKILGIEDNFIRISCGIEDSKDLLDDVKQALEKA